MVEKEEDLRKTVVRYYDEKAEGEAAKTTQAPCCPDSEELGQLQTVQTVISFGCGLPVLSSDLRRGEVVLDLGSGTGPDVMAAAREVGPEGLVIGLDMSGRLMKRAYSSMHSLGLSNTAFIVAAMENIPVRDAALDVVISNCVINLSPDKAQVFEEIRRILKPQGRASISDVVTDSDLPTQVKENAEAWCACIGGTLKTGDYLRLIREAGFANVEMVSKDIFDDHAWGTDVKAFALTLNAHGIKRK